MAKHWIISAAKGSKLTELAWLRVIEADERLATHRSVRVPNPFKPGEKMDVNPNPLSVSAIVDGDTLGSLSWAEDESPTVIAICQTEITQARMQSVVEEVAEQLSCTVDEV